MGHISHSDKNTAISEYPHSIYNYKKHSDPKIINNNYKLIIKNKTYKDYSVFGIVKHLYKIHRINKYQYKDIINKINNNKNLSDNIMLMINSYYKTIKTSTSKNTITGLNKSSSQQYKRYINITNNKQVYSVYIKKSVFLKLFQNKWLDTNYKDLMINKIQVELKTKIKEYTSLKTI